MWYSDHSNELHGICVHTGGASQPVLVADEHAGAEEENTCPELERLQLAQVLKRLGLVQVRLHHWQVRLNLQSSVIRVRLLLAKEYRCHGACRLHIQLQPRLCPEVTCLCTLILLTL